MILKIEELVLYINSFIYNETNLIARKNVRIKVWIEVEQLDIRCVNKDGRVLDCRKDDI